MSVVVLFFKVSLIYIFFGDFREWEQQLNDMQLLLEHCVFIQDRWCRLEPLLTSPDMLSAAPDEARKFFAIDKSWREVLTAIGLCKQIFSLLFAEHISERLGSCIQQIQTLEKNLHNVLECKRQQYPRFFLLAEDELKELLSFSRDPRRFVTLIESSHEEHGTAFFQIDFLRRYGVYTKAFMIWSLTMKATMLLWLFHQSENV